MFQQEILIIENVWPVDCYFDCNLVLAIKHAQIRRLAIRNAIARSEARKRNTDSRRFERTSDTVLPRSLRSSKSYYNSRRIFSVS